MRGRKATFLTVVILYLIGAGQTLLAERAQAPHSTPTAGKRRAELNAPPPPESHSDLIAQYCLGCHNDRLKSGGMSLQQLDLQHVEQNAQQSEKIIHKLKAGLMPPAGAKRPDAAAARAFVGSLENAIDKCSRGAASCRGARVPAAEPRRIRPVDPRLARHRHRRHGASAARCAQRRLRQHRGRTVVLACGDGRLHPGGGARGD